jgi:tRNA pseudouridine55 synthase
VENPESAISTLSNTLSPHGWIILDKPLGLSSAQGVAAVKRLLRPLTGKNLKIGHGGTLDPLATGVLPIALGEATKLSGYLLDADKGYAVTISFGTATSTEDAEGEIIARSDVRPTLAQIIATVPQFMGPISQVPPAYSALKVDGKRAYARARAGEEVVLKARQVTIREMSVTAAYAKQADQFETLTLDVVCSKGTYIRSLARDMAVALGTVGHVASLRRTRAGPFLADQAISLDSLADFCARAVPEQVILPLTAGLDDIPALAVTPEQATRLRQGQQLMGVSEASGTYLAMASREGDTPVPIAIVECENSTVRVLRGLNLI